MKPRKITPLELADLSEDWHNDEDEGIVQIIGKA